MANETTGADASEFTLEDAIRDMLGSDDEKETDADAGKTADEAPTDDDGGDGSGKESDSEEETGDEDEDEEGLLERLAALEEQHGKADDSDPWVPVRTEEQYLLGEQAALQQGFLQGLKDIKNDAGKSIYEMQEPEFEKFLQELDDDGKEALKLDAHASRKQAIAQAERFMARQADFNERLNTYHQYKLEMEVITDIAKQLKYPQVVKRYQDGSITRHLTELAAADSSIAPLAATKEGLYKLAIRAIRDLGIIKSKGQETSKQPSAPDAKATSKKVKTKSSDSSDEALMARVSKYPDEWKKLDEKTRDRLLLASTVEAMR